MKLTEGARVSPRAQCNAKEWFVDACGASESLRETWRASKNSASSRELQANDIEKLIQQSKSKNLIKGLHSQARSQKGKMSQKSPKPRADLEDMQQLVKSKPNKIENVLVHAF